jgi:uncharacterized protein (TIGR02271 family)
MSGDKAGDEGGSLAIIEERARIDRRRIATGRVRARTKTEREETTASADLEGEAVEVTRVPIDREVETAPGVRTEGDLTVVPVVEEVLVVEKRLVLKEEIHIRRRSTREAVEVPVTLRRQRAVVDRLDADGDRHTFTEEDQ